MTRTPALMLVLALSSWTDAAHADVRLPKVFGNHMVLQQGKPIRVFGWADAGEQVTVLFNGQTAQTTGTADGRFRVDLPAMHDRLVAPKSTGSDDRGNRLQLAVAQAQKQHLVAERIEINHS